MTMKTEIRLRRVAGVVFTVWLLGWIPAIVFSRPYPGRYDPQIYAWWTVILPLSLGAAIAIGICLRQFYGWAFGNFSREEVEARFAELERQLREMP